MRKTTFLRPLLLLLLLHPPDRDALVKYTWTASLILQRQSVRHREVIKGCGFGTFLSPSAYTADICA